MIRNLTINDYENLFALWLKIDGVGLRNLDDSKEGIEKFIIRNPKSCFVYEIDNMIVGVILCGNDGRRGYIYHMAVLDEYRNMGIGTRLVDQALNVLKDEGINKVGLVVFKENKLGYDFWKNYGFNERNDLNYMDISLNPNN